MKFKILENVWEQLGLEIEGSVVSVYPDLSLITLKKGKGKNRGRRVETVRKCILIKIV